MRIPFVKMQGLGNDFIVIDGIRNSIQLTPTMIKAMGDRNRGIGFDQLLLVETAKRPTVDFEYRIFNADGGEVAQCGNGARCVGRFLIETGLVSLQKHSIYLGTLQSILEVVPHSIHWLTVNMGKPIFNLISSPFDWGDCCIEEKGTVQLGNPHIILQVADVKFAPVTTLGAEIGCHSRFPEGVNVNFMQYVDKQHIYLRVYERGAGETLACGSGACASVVIGRVCGLLDTQVKVSLPGGDLQITWQDQSQPVWMTGPAERVFTGEWLEE